MARAISHSFAALTREILFLPLEHKIHIFSPPCNILYVVEVVTRVTMVMELVVTVVTSVTVVVVMRVGSGGCDKSGNGDIEGVISGGSHAWQWWR